MIHGLDQWFSKIFFIDIGSVYFPAKMPAATGLAETK